MARLARPGAFKWVVAGVAALLVVVAVFVWALFRIMAPMADAATHFVITAGTAGPAAAYEEASPALRAAMPEPQFEAKLVSLRLTHARSVQWWSRKQTFSAGVVAGTVTLADGDNEPVTIHLVKSGGKWKVSEFYYGTSLNFPGE
jgi:hypothetical protein